MPVSGGYKLKNSSTILVNSSLGIGNVYSPTSSTHLHSIITSPPQTMSTVVLAACVVGFLTFLVVLLFIYKSRASCHYGEDGGLDSNIHAKSALDHECVVLEATGAAVTTPDDNRHGDIEVTLSGIVVSTCDFGNNTSSQHQIQQLTSQHHLSKNESLGRLQHWPTEDNPILCPDTLYC